MAVDYEVQGRIAVITLNRPEARNAVNGEVARGLEAAIDRLEEDPDVWIAVLAANPGDGDRPVFSAGADLKAINEGRAGELATAKGGFAGFVYRERRKPVIAAVDGLATAGGCEIVLACDLVVASTRSGFGLAEVKRNLIAGAGGLFRLPQAIGRNVAMEAILTAEPLSAERAYQLGLVNRLVEPDQVHATALALAEQIAGNAPLAVWESRKVVLAAGFEDEETLKKMTDAGFGTVLASADTAEGLSAFIEKRAPNWTGT
jgi:enoyl-CoA hydratase